MPPRFQIRTSMVGVYGTHCQLQDCISKTTSREASDAKNLWLMP
jgi:hypothetical protein